MAALSTQARMAKKIKVHPNVGDIVRVRYNGYHGLPTWLCGSKAEIVEVHKTRTTVQILEDPYGFDDTDNVPRRIHLSQIERIIRRAKKAKPKKTVKTSKVTKLKTAKAKKTKKAV